MAEWSKALVLGISLFGGVGTHPTAARLLLYLILYVMSFDEETDTDKKKRAISTSKLHLLIFFDFFSSLIQLTKIVIQI